jgi:hypothetical protein
VDELTRNLPMRSRTKGEFGRKIKGGKSAQESSLLVCIYMSEITVISVGSVWL